MKVGKPWGEYYYVKWAGVDPRDGYNVVRQNGNLTKSYSKKMQFLSANNAMHHGPVALAPSSDGKGFLLVPTSLFMLGQYMLNNERFLQRIPLCRFGQSNCRNAYHVAEAGRYNQNCHSRLPDAV